MTLRSKLRRLLPRLRLTIRHVEPGLKLRVDARRQIGLVLRGAGSYEPRYVAALRELVSAGNTVVDVGANIGFYTALFCRWAGETGRVIAYEPDPENLGLLRVNAPETANIRAIALAAVKGESTFTLDHSTGYTGHLGEGVSYADHASGTISKMIRVATVTLDEDMAVLGARPDVVKIDIEGGESAALAGAGRTLREVRPLVVLELSEWGAAGAAAKSLALLHEARYLVFDLDTAKPVHPGVSAWMAIAVPEERAQEASIVRALRAASLPVEGPR